MRMAARPPRIQLVGLLPAILKPCGPSCAQPFMNNTVAELRSEELDETPSFIRENADRAHAIAENLMRDFGSAIQIEVVGLDTPKGIWLGLRHRFGKGFAVVVDGREVFRDGTDYVPVREAVARAVGSRGLSSA
jgi:hypothetical protein